MIVFGGVIGIGFFFGVGGCFVLVGFGLFLVYGICGIFVFLILCVFGELVLYCLFLGLFVFYVCEFYGEKVVFVVGWMYFLNWVMMGIVDIIVIVYYCYYWWVF